MPRGRPRKNKLEELCNDDINENTEANDMTDDDASDDLEFESTDEADQLVDFDALQEDSKARPLVTSPEWHEYVMSQFTDEELLKEKNDRNEYTGKQYPSVFGLRRVAELLVGELLENNSRFIELGPTFAIAECQLVFSNGEERFYFTDVGNCHVNTPEPFDVHLPSIAATRAEGRALRKALRIRTVCAEEMQGAKKGGRTLEEPVSNANLESLNNDDNTITGAQIAAVKTMAKREKLNVTNLVENRYPGFELESLSTAQGRELLAFIHQVVAKKVNVPDSVKEV